MNLPSDLLAGKGLQNGLDLFIEKEDIGVV
jgi:hypothetical protein